MNINTRWAGEQLPNDTYIPTILKVATNEAIENSKVTRYTTNSGQRSAVSFEDSKFSTYF